MSSLSAVKLLEVEPDIGRFLTPEERAAVTEAVSVPVATVLKGEFTLLDEGKPFAALVLEGMLFQRLRVGDQVALRLLGPGDIPAAFVEMRQRWCLPTEVQSASVGRLLGAASRLRSCPWVRAGRRLRACSRTCGSVDSRRLERGSRSCERPRARRRQFLRSEDPWFLPIWLDSSRSIWVWSGGLPLRIGGIMDHG